MPQQERRNFLIQRLMEESPQYHSLEIPAAPMEQKRLLRALMNVRPPRPIGEDFLSVQDRYLREETEAKGITDIADLVPCEPGIYLWRGDITALRCDAVVNAANAGMTGCYIPGHNCIDNCIHTFAGIQLRLTCAQIMQAQGHEEPVGTAKLTPAYNLPCRYILHTVGPTIAKAVTPEDERLLAACYRSCLALAKEHDIKSVAFCCISTGVFRFPKDRAAQIAVATVRQHRDGIEVIFNVHSHENYDIYRRLLG